jgi:hypothetical protein
MTLQLLVLLALGLMCGSELNVADSPIQCSVGNQPRCMYQFAHRLRHYSAM